MAGGDPKLAGAVDKLLGDAAVDAANTEAVRTRIVSVLVDVVHEAIPTAEDAPSYMRDHRSPGSMRGAICGAIVFEGWAPEFAAAEKLRPAEDVTLHPNHHFKGVRPMTGLTTRSMPVMVVENKTYGACCTINEGLGKVMRFGGNDAEVLKRLRWLCDVLGPALGAARQGVGLKAADRSRLLSMGNEMHQRLHQFLREIAPTLGRTLGRLAEALAWSATTTSSSSMSPWPWVKP